MSDGGVCVKQASVRARLMTGGIFDVHAGVQDLLLRFLVRRNLFHVIVYHRRFVHENVCLTRMGFYSRSALVVPETPSIGFD